MVRPLFALLIFASAAWGEVYTTLTFYGFEKARIFFQGVEKTGSAHVQPDGGMRYYSLCTEGAPYHYRVEVREINIHGVEASYKRIISFIGGEHLTLRPNDFRPTPPPEN